MSGERPIASELRDRGDYRETDESVRGLPSYQQAKAIHDLTLHDLEKRQVDQDHLVRLESRDDGLFDVIVLRRVN